MFLLTKKNKFYLKYISTIYLLNFTFSQLEMYGSVPVGKHRKSAEHGSTIRDSMSQEFFREFRPGSCSFHPEMSGNHWRYPIRNTASMFRWFSVPFCGFMCIFLAGSSEIHSFLETETIVLDNGITRIQRKLRITKLSYGQNFRSKFRSFCTLQGWIFLCKYIA